MIDYLKKYYIYHQFGESIVDILIDMLNDFKNFLKR